MVSRLYENAIKKQLDEKDMERIADLEKYLYDTDYIPLKIVEAPTDEIAQTIREEYREILLQRQEARNEINQIMGDVE